MMLLILNPDVKGNTLYNQLGFCNNHLNTESLVILPHRVKS